MNFALVLLTEAALSITISLIVLRVLSDPLVELLAQLCPDVQSARFWLSYSQLMLIIAPLLLVLFTDAVVNAGGAAPSLRLALIAVLAGLLFSLYLIGRRLGAFITAPDASEPAA
ncbi:hypothetical protein R0381_001500 [Jeongeupia wiesaeckerbachi]|uniref:hypothetical protein n=1 Tax=Jeongeupia wiesaeckerbachi TaxID=3051218 RepID=UPI003D808A8C